jgi:thymidylate synthase
MCFEHGVAKTDRTGTGTTSVFGHQMRFDLNEGFPLVTTKKVHFLKAIIARTAVVPAGDATSSGCRTRLHASGTNGRAPTATWARCTACSGAAGPHPTAATSTRSPQVVQQLKTNPDSRRIIVSAWNVADLPQMALMPCHAFFQFYVAPGGSPSAEGRLSCQLYQRSADIFLGVPFLDRLAACRLPS